MKRRLSLFGLLLAFAGCQPGSEGEQTDRADSFAPDASALGQRAAMTGPSASEPVPSSWGLGSHQVDSFVEQWDLDVGPDGRGLPEGGGSALQGAPLYQTLCASCHGVEGEGISINPALVGRGPAEEQFRGRSIGEFWPYATTLYDYIRRSMPQTAPGSLKPDEIYSLVAWMLAENGRIGPTELMNAQTLAAVPMPGRAHFVEDDRTGGPEVR